MKFVLAAYAIQPIEHDHRKLIEFLANGLHLFAYPKPVDGNFDKIALQHDIAIRELAKKKPVVPVPFGFISGNKADILSWAEENVADLHSAYSMLHSSAQVSLFIQNRNERCFEGKNYLRNLSSSVTATREAKQDAECLARKLCEIGIITQFMIGDQRRLDREIRIDGLVEKDRYGQSDIALKSMLEKREDNIRIAGPYLPYGFLSKYVRRGQR